MKLSIITPSFNQSQFIETTIKSVLEQGYSELEYIIIDGGSSDNTVEIIKKYEDKIDFWVSEKDDGQSNAINKGFKKATGDVVAWINSDDYYYPNIFDKVMSRFKADDELVLLYGNCAFIKEDGQFLRYFSEVQPYSGSILRNYSDYIMQPTTFFRRDALEAVGFLDESLHYGMDWDLWCNFACQYPMGIKYIEDLVAVNREYGDTKTSSGGKERLQELKKINSKHKTTGLNKAALLYRGAEFHHQSRLPKFVKDRLVALLAISIGAAGKLKQKRLFGLVPHSVYIEKSAFILQALWEVKGDKVKFVLENPARKFQSLKISINGKLLHASMFNMKEKKEVILNLPECENNLLEIHFECTHSFSRNKVALKLHEFCIFN